MAEGQNSQEKTEQPTRKKLEDARKEGQTVKSKELVSFFSLITIFSYFIFIKNNIIADIYQIYNIIFKSIDNDILFPSNLSLLTNITKSLALCAFKILIVPIILAALLSGIIAMIQVGGIIISTKAMKIDFNKFNIVSNAKNIFSMKNLKKFLKDMAQLAVMCIVAYLFVYHNFDDILYSGYHKLGVISTLFFNILGELFLYLLIVYLIFAVIDYILEYKAFMKQMMMSIEEIRKEMKDTEVSQQIKQRQRELHQEMMSEDEMDLIVKNSTLVVTNPTHLAIVILYNPEKIKLPVVIFKAADKTAAIVRRLAQKHNKLMVRDIWLARKLYNLAEIKKYIPSSLITAVADIIGKNFHLLPKDLQNSFSKNIVTPTTAPLVQQQAPSVIPTKTNMW